MELAGSVHWSRRKGTVNTKNTQTNSSQTALFPGVLSPTLRQAAGMLTRPIYIKSRERIVNVNIGSDCRRIFDLLADGAWHDGDTIAAACRGRAWGSRLRELRTVSVIRDGIAWRIRIERRAPQNRGAAWLYRMSLGSTGEVL